MRRILLFAATLIISCSLHAQRTIKLNNLWEKPQVHALFQGYTISFKIKDIDRALILLAETGDTSFGLSSGLYNTGKYHVELYPGFRTEYKNPLQPLLQRGVGPFLLLAGQARIVSPRHKKLKEIIADIQPVDDSLAYINFYDPRNKKLLFSGSMPLDMYKKDLGID